MLTIPSHLHVPYHRTPGDASCPRAESFRHGHIGVNFLVDTGMACTLQLITDYSSHSRVLNYMYHRGASRTLRHHIHVDVDVLSADFPWLLTHFYQPTGGKYQFIPAMGAPYRLHVHVAADSHCSASSSVASSLAVLSPTQAGQAGLQAYLLGYSTVSRLSIMLLGIILR